MSYSGGILKGRHLTHVYNFCFQRPNPICAFIHVFPERFVHSFVCSLCPVGILLRASHFPDIGNNPLPPPQPSGGNTLAQLTEVQHSPAITDGPQRGQAHVVPTVTPPFGLSFLGTTKFKSLTFLFKTL